MFNVERSSRRGRQDFRHAQQAADSRPAGCRSFCVCTIRSQPYRVIDQLIWDFAPIYSCSSWPPSETESNCSVVESFRDHPVLERHQRRVNGVRRARVFAQLSQAATAPQRSQPQEWGGNCKYVCADQNTGGNIVERLLSTALTLHSQLLCLSIH